MLQCRRGRATNYHIYDHRKTQDKNLFHPLFLEKQFVFVESFFWHRCKSHTSRFREFWFKFFYLLSRILERTQKGDAGVTREIWLEKEDNSLGGNVLLEFYVLQEEKGKLLFGNSLFCKCVESSFDPLFWIFFPVLFYVLLIICLQFF